MLSIDAHEIQVTKLSHDGLSLFYDARSCKVGPVETTDQEQQNEEASGPNPSDVSLLLTSPVRVPTQLHPALRARQVAAAVRYGQG